MAFWNNMFNRAKYRVANYDAQIIPGCDSNCTFNGTDADWQDLRTNWINDCMTNNSGGFLQSKNKTLRNCTAAFDSRAAGIQMQQYAENAQDYNDIKKISMSGNTGLIIGAFLFVGLIIYLLTSK